MNTQKFRSLLGLAALSLVMFIVTLDTTITNIALPTITDYFKTSLTNTTWISTVYVLVLSVFIIPASKLADQFGRKKVMLIGLVTFGAGSALCGLAQSIHILILMRILQGIGGAIITPVMIPLSVEAFGREKAGQAVGIIGAVTAIAAAGGPPIGGLIIKFLNWQSIFFVNVPVVIVTLILICICFRESYDNTISKRIDWFGMIFLSVGLFQLTFVLIKGYIYGWTSRPIIFLIIGAIVSLTLFSVVELKMKEPLIEFALFREITFAASTIGYFLCGFAIVCSSLIFNYFLQNVRGYTALNSAYIIMSMSITVIFSMPLGSVLAKKMSYRVIIFPGILLMSISMFLLYRLRIDTSTFVMVGDMIILGFGFGLSCQSLVSSCKFIPQTKAGNASGIVNAARQMGTCLGIALLVGMMTHNVDIAKNSIESSAIDNINNANISDSIKDVMIRDIENSFENSGNSDNASTSNLQETFKNDVTEALTKISTSTAPDDNETLNKLYEGVNSLSNGANETNNGQNSLNDGLNSLSTGFDGLLNGSNSLASGLKALDNGLDQSLSGAQTLNSSSEQGLNTLSLGIQSLNGGALGMLSQFSPSSGSNNPTIYDSVNGIATGTSELSSNLKSYISAVNNTYYLIITCDSSSPQLLDKYKNELVQAQAKYAVASDADREQYKQQLQVLTNLVTLYTAGINSSVTTEADFEKMLITLAQQSGDNQNVVSSGNRISGGADQLNSASEQVAAQFHDGGAFKAGMEQLADGTTKLNQNSNDLNSLQFGIGKLTSSLFNLQSGSGKLLIGSLDLQSGITTAKDATNQLMDGSDQLVEASTQLKDGMSQLESGIGKAGQANVIQDITNQLRVDKNDLITGAFNKVFLIAAIILLIFSISGLFTDRKGNTNEKL